MKSVMYVSEHVFDQQDPMSPDVRMVQWMSTGQDATAPGTFGEPPVVAVFEIHDPRSVPEMSQLASQIKKCLASNQAVAVTPLFADIGFTWDAASIGVLTSGEPDRLSRLVQWQCMLIHTSCILIRLTTM